MIGGGTKTGPEDCGADDGTAIRGDEVLIAINTCLILQIKSWCNKDYSMYNARRDQLGLYKKPIFNDMPA